MPWLPILFVCMMGNCQFMAGEIYWSQDKCEAAVLAATKELESQGASAVGVCVEIRVS